MAHHYLQEPLEPFPSVLNHVIGKAVREDFARKWWDSDARRLSLEDITEGFEFAVAAAYRRRLELEGGNVGAHYDFVGCVHATADSYILISMPSYRLAVSHLPCVMGFLTCARDKCEQGCRPLKGKGAPDQPTSISRKFSGGPYSSSKLCDRASGSDCMVGVYVNVEAGRRLGCARVGDRWRGYRELMARRIGCYWFAGGWQHVHNRPA